MGEKVAVDEKKYDLKTEGIVKVRQAKLGIFRRCKSFAGREPPTRYRNRTLCEVTNTVKLRRGRYQTATQVKVLSPVIAHYMMADCIFAQECNNYMFVWLEHVIIIGV